MRVVFIALLCLPVLEIAVLISIGGLIGLPLTIALVLLTAIVGTFLLRQQGVSLLFSAQQQVANGQLPASTMIEGVAVAVGGALLLTPGFITDTLGFFCLLPITRQLLLSFVMRNVSVVGGAFGERTNVQPPRSDSSGVTLEGDFKRDE